MTDVVSSKSRELTDYEQSVDVKTAARFIGVSPSLVCPPLAEPIVLMSLHRLIPWQAAPQQSLPPFRPAGKLQQKDGGKSPGLDQRAGPCPWPIKGMTKQSREDGGARGLTRPPRPLAHCGGLANRLLPCRQHRGGHR